MVRKDWKQGARIVQASGWTRARNDGTRARTSLLLLGLCCSARGSSEARPVRATGRRVPALIPALHQAGCSMRRECETRTKNASQNLPSPAGRAASPACVARTRAGISPPSFSRLGMLASLWPARSDFVRRSKSAFTILERLARARSAGRRQPQGSEISSLSSLRPLRIPRARAAPHLVRESRSLIERRASRGFDAKVAELVGAQTISVMK